MSLISNLGTSGQMPTFDANPPNLYSIAEGTNPGLTAARNTGNISPFVASTPINGGNNTPPPSGNLIPPGGMSGTRTGNIISGSGDPATGNPPGNSSPSNPPIVPQSPYNRNFNPQFNGSSWSYAGQTGTMDPRSSVASSTANEVAQMLGGSVVQTPDILGVSQDQFTIRLPDGREIPANVASQILQSGIQNQQQHGGTTASQFGPDYYMRIAMNDIQNLARAPGNEAMAWREATNNYQAGNPTSFQQEMNRISPGSVDPTTGAVPYDGRQLSPGTYNNGQFTNNQTVNPSQNFNSNFLPQGPPGNASSGNAPNSTPAPGNTTSAGNPSTGSGGPQNSDWFNLLNSQYNNLYGLFNTLLSRNNTTTTTGNTSPQNRRPAYNNSYQYYLPFGSNQQRFNPFQYGNYRNSAFNVRR
jgi:hypothetical protein